MDPPDLPSPPDLQGRRALVTGSTSGIGAAVADALSAAGADVVRHGLPDEPVAGPALAIDLAKPGTGQDLAQAALAQGPIDILVHSAAVQHRRDWREVTATEASNQLQVNVLAALELTQVLVPPMGERGWGRVVLVGSVQRRSPDPHLAVYAASKGALHTLAIALAKDVSPVGVTVNTLAPGVVATARNADVLADNTVRDRWQAEIPVGRIAGPVDCVGAALLLCSDAGSYITGQELVVDGGLTL